MDKIIEAVLRYIIKRVMIQGKHKEKIEWLFKIINEEAQAQFMEENAYTTDHFLAQCFDAAMVSDIKEIVNDG